MKCIIATIKYDIGNNSISKNSNTNPACIRILIWFFVKPVGISQINLGIVYLNNLTKDSLNLMGFLKYKDTR